MAVCLSYMEWGMETGDVRPVEWRTDNEDAGGCFDEHWRLVWAVGSSACPYPAPYLGGLRFSFAVNGLRCAILNLRS